MKIKRALLNHENVMQDIRKLAFTGDMDKTLKVRIACNGEITAVKKKMSLNNSSSSHL